MSTCTPALSPGLQSSGIPVPTAEKEPDFEPRTLGPGTCTEITRLNGSVKGAASSPLCLLLSRIPWLGLTPKALQHLSAAHCPSLILSPPPLSHPRTPPTPALLPEGPLFPEHSISIQALHFLVRLPGLPLPHLSPANSYSSLNAQFRGHLLRDACLNFPVRSMAPSSSTSYYTFCRVLTSPITSYILFPMALGAGS